MGGNNRSHGHAGWWALACAALLGCARAAPPRYAEVLAPPAAGEAREARAEDLGAKLGPPAGECLERAERYLGEGGRLMSTPLDPALRRDSEALIRDLHPLARRVLARTHGLWYAEGIEGAAAVFLTCGVDSGAARGGFILLDAHQFPFDQPLRDAEVPALYWRALAGTPPPLGEDDPLLRPPGSLRVAPRDHAARYLLLHEIGHALSLLAGEFVLDQEQRMQVGGTGGFTGQSWALVTAETAGVPGARPSGVVSAILPRRGLDPMVWGSILDVIGADPDTLVPGYALQRPHRSPDTRARDVCAGALGLPRAGFVTPTAARYPTEDFAEMFAHAILAAEGKLRPADAIVVDLPGCGVREIPSPYFSAEVAPKRAYVERALGIRPDATCAGSRSPQAGPRASAPCGRRP